VQTYVTQIQSCGSGSGSNLFDDQKLKKKNTDEKFLIKKCNLLMSKLQEKPSALKREHPEFQK
jgi:hypothetical protein